MEKWLRSGCVFSQIFYSGSGSKRKTQNPTRVDSANPNAVPPLLYLQKEHKNIFLQKNGWMPSTWGETVFKHRFTNSSPSKFLSALWTITFGSLVYCSRRSIVHNTGDIQRWPESFFWLCSCSKIFESGSGNFANLRIRLLFRLRLQ